MAGSVFLRNNRNVRRYRVKGLKKNRFSRFVGLADRRSICLDAGLNPTFVDRHDKFARRKNRRRQLGEQFGQVDFMLAHSTPGHRPQISGADIEFQLVVWRCRGS